MQSWKVQTLETLNDANGHRVIIRETNSFRGIPYADYFNVNTEWVVTSTVPTPSTGNANIPMAPLNSPIAASVTRGMGLSNSNTSSCTAVIYLDFQFHKSTWLQGTIESNTTAELIGVYALWLESAQDTLRRSLDRPDRRSSSTASLSVVGTGAGVGMGDGELGNMESGGISASTVDGVGERLLIDYEDEADDDEDEDEGNSSDDGDNSGHIRHGNNSRRTGSGAGSGMRKYDSAGNALGSGSDGGSDVRSERSKSSSGGKLGEILHKKQYYKKYILIVNCLLM